MIKELVTDEALLSAPCEPATVEDIAVATDLTDTLASLENAGCLAANQIGVTRALFAFEDESGAVRVMANPKVLFGLGADKVGESCLTHEGISQDQAVLRRVRRWRALSSQGRVRGLGGSDDSAHGRSLRRQARLVVTFTMRAAACALDGTGRTRRLFK